MAIDPKKLAALGAEIVEPKDMTAKQKALMSHGGFRPNAGRPKKPDAKKSWARKLSLDVIAYLDSTPNAVETLETTIRNSKGFRTWKKNLEKTISKT